MTQQINLYEARLRPRFEPATARNLAISTVIALIAVTALAVYAAVSADQQAAVLAAVQAEVRAEQERMTALAKAVAERRVSPALAGDLVQSRTLLEARQEVMDVLTSGKIGNVDGFSGILFGFARQAQADVWLTGFVIAGGGDEIEIRGRLLDAARLPAYVQRLSSEPAFQGRRFATLDMRAVEPDVVRTDATKPEVEKPAPGAPLAPMPNAVLPRYVEFALRSANATNAARDGGAASGGKP